MQIKNTSEGGSVPIYCYQYDAGGFYKGMYRMQEDPKSPGSFLLPKNATRERPSMKEGFIPRWNGEAWDLVDSKLGLKQKSDYQSEFALRQQQSFEQLARNAEQIVEVQFQKLINEAMTDFHKRLDGFREEIRVMCDLTLGDAKERVIEELSAEFGVRVRGMLDELKEITRAAESKIEDVTKTVKVYKESLIEKIPEESKGLLTRLFGS